MQSVQAANQHHLTFSRTKEMLDGSMLNKSLNQFKFDSTRFQQAFNFFTLSAMLSNLFKSPRHLVQQSVEATVETVKKGLLIIIVDVA